MRATIARMIRADVSRSGQSGYVAWEDTRGKRGTTHGALSNAHMRALLERAVREGVDLVAPSCGSCGADLAPSTSYPWHYADEDCRAVRAPLAVERAS